MIKVGIIGGAGYTAGELLRLLVNHPQVHIEFIQSKSHKGQKISSVHHDLVGETDLSFDENLSDSADVVFLCLGHGKSVDFLNNNSIPEQTKVIDLSQDFRLSKNANFQDREFVYGLPELNKQKIAEASNIANPGCFATCIQLGILPLAALGLAQDDIHINAITGSTGAGQAPSPTTHFSWRNNNVSVYKAFEHQHLFEITESFKSLQPEFDHSLNFIPV
ncbi:MAG: N-acetyl-gamma-glutamyl-phosphate reductase, partial [Bacteroidota bacterium]